LVRFTKKKFFKKQETPFKTEEIKKFKNEKPKNFIIEEDNPIQKSLSIKSLTKTGTKYAYIIAAAAFLSGIFTPFTIEVELNNIIIAMLVLLLGVAGGALIFKTITREDPSLILTLIGLALIIISSILIFQVAYEGFGMNLDWQDPS